MSRGALCIISHSNESTRFYMRMFYVKNIFAVFSPIIVVLHCYKRPDTSLYNNINQQNW